MAQVPKPDSKAAAITESKNDIDLDRLAAEELLRDAQKNATRAESYGSTAWKKGPLPKPNLNFLTRAVSGTVIQNAWQDQRRRREENGRHGSPPRGTDYHARNQSARCHFRSEGLDKQTSDFRGARSDRNERVRSGEGKVRDECDVRRHDERSMRVSPRRLQRSRSREDRRSERSLKGRSAKRKAGKQE